MPDISTCGIGRLEARRETPRTRWRSWWRSRKLTSVWSMLTTQTFWNIPSSTDRHFNSSIDLLHSPLDCHSLFCFSLYPSIRLELSLLKNLLQCYVAIHSKLDCISALVAIKEMNNMFNKEFLLFESKQVKEVHMETLTVIRVISNTNSLALTT